MKSRFYARAMPALTDAIVRRFGAHPQKLTVDSAPMRKFVEQYLRTHWEALREGRAYVYVRVVDRERNVYVTYSLALTVKFSVDYSGMFARL